MALKMDPVVLLLLLELLKFRWENWLSWHEKPGAMIESRGGFTRGSGEGIGIVPAGDCTGGVGTGGSGRGREERCLGFSSSQ